MGVGLGEESAAEADYVCPPGCRRLRYQSLIV